MNAAEYEENGVDNNGYEDGSGDPRAVVRVFFSAYELVMVRPEEKAEGTEDEDGEYRNDRAGPCVDRADDGLHDGDVRGCVVWTSCPVNSPGMGLAEQGLSGCVVIDSRTI